MPTLTKLFDSARAASPGLSGTPGSLISILDACLVNGLGTVSVSTLVVTNGVAEATFPTSHSFITDSVALIGGSNVTALNGEKRILSTTGTGIKFDATGVSNQTASGAMSAKIASAGWTKPYSGTNIAVYRLDLIQGTGFYLRVDDTGTTAAQIRGYETMTDSNTGKGAFPTSSQQPVSGLFWSKSSTADTSLRSWFLLADARGVFFLPRSVGTTGNYQSFYFGDISSFKSNDPYGCLVRGNTTNSSTASVQTEDLQYVQRDYSVGGCFLARSATALGGSIAAYHGAGSVVPIGNYFSGGSGLPYPSPIDNSLNLSDCVVHNEAGTRGYLPGLKYTAQVVSNSFSTGDIVLGTGLLSGKKLTCIKTGPVSGTQSGVLFFDHVGDWR